MALAIREAGLSVPGDVSIIGFDGLAYTRHISPLLTTIRQDTEQIGEEAARLLLQQITNKGKDLPARSIKVPVRLLTGETVAPPNEPASR